MMKTKKCGLISMVKNSLVVRVVNAESFHEFWLQIKNK